MANMREMYEEKSMSKIKILLISMSKEKEKIISSRNPDHNIFIAKFLKRKSIPTSKQAFF